MTEAEAERLWLSKARRLAQEYGLTPAQQQLFETSLRERQAAGKKSLERRHSLRLEALRDAIENNRVHSEEGKTIVDVRPDLRRALDQADVESPQCEASVRQAIERIATAEQVARVRQRMERRTASLEILATRPWGSWEAYVDAFADVYGLDASQQAVARSRLREALIECEQYNREHREDFATARSIENRQERFERFARLREPVERMFEQLKDSLEAIPTNAQHLAASALLTNRPLSSSRPAAADSRPSE